MAKFEALIPDEDGPTFDKAVWRFLSRLIGPEPPEVVMHRYPAIEGCHRVVESDDAAVVDRFVVVLDVELMMARSGFASY